MVCDWEKVYFGDMPSKIESKKYMLWLYRVLKIISKTKAYTFLHLFIIIKKTI